MTALLTASRSEQLGRRQSDTFERAKPLAFGVSVVLHGVAALTLILAPRLSSMEEAPPEPPTITLAFEIPQQSAAEEMKAPDEPPPPPPATVEAVEPPIEKPPPEPLPAEPTPSLEPPPAPEPEPPRNNILTTDDWPVPPEPPPPPQPARLPRPLQPHPLRRHAEQALAAQLPQTNEPGKAPTASAPPISVSTSWQSLLAAWIQARRHYPAQARQRGVEGSVELRVVIAHDGHVLKAQVAQSSGSDLLDQAALAMFDGADAPPFPGEMAAPQITITLNIRYRLADR